MSLRKYKTPKEEIRLPIDTRQRISLAKFLPSHGISSVKAYKEGDKIILEPMAEVPAHELWLFHNPEALQAIQQGLKESKEGKIVKRGSFSQYAGNDI